MPDFLNAPLENRQHRYKARLFRYRELLEDELIEGHLLFDEIA